VVSTCSADQPLRHREPPLRWVAGANAIATVEQKAKDLLAQAHAYRELSSNLAHEDAAWVEDNPCGTLAVATGIVSGGCANERSEERNDRLLPPLGQEHQKCPLTCRFGARGGIRTLDLPITSRKAFVQQVPPRPVLAAHVGGVVH
jgi:hypothetical protein